MNNPIVNMKNAAINSMIEWAQTNKNLEAMKIRMETFFDFAFDKEASDDTPISQLAHDSLRYGAAMAIVYLYMESIPRDRLGDVLREITTIAAPNIAQQLDKHFTHLNRH